MPSLSTIRASNANWSTEYTPVVVCVGGTSGIGQGIAESIAQHTGGNAHIVIVGRNRTGGNTTISHFPKPTQAGITHEFITCDLSSLVETKRVANTIVSRFGRVNMLFLTSGVIFTAATDPATTEGILPVMGPIYYGRWAFIDVLLPALRAASEADQDARVMTVYSAGMGTPLDVQDPDFGLTKAFLERKEGIMPNVGRLSTYHDLMVEGFAARPPTITFVHAHPGLVNTPLYTRSPSRLIRVASFIAQPLIWALTTSAAQAGEMLLYALRSAPAGASRTGQYGDDIGIGLPVQKGDRMYAGTEEMRDALWEHTKKIVKAVDDK
ncbi:hypothetical protein HMN09_00164300 [Mycena chlorophos]|uniref:NAD(P)-binding protein n=1 Tax=Mycena chlorophos TaxID=658473 RepID=A0A8H6TKR5_MYCCL|nr:hypothetical protein HMN09_00164300 [Mycena chlorophos]